MSTLPGLFFLGLLSCCVSAAPPAPSNITLRSQNFQHILTWQPADISDTALFYRVQYLNINGDRKTYVPKHCSNTTDLKCDLTDELTDVSGQYAVEVKSLSPIGSGSTWADTQFNPLGQTFLGPPIVHLTACDSCIYVTIQAPVSHLKSSDKTKTQSLLDVYHILNYILTLKGPRGIQNEISEEAVVENFTTVIDNLLPKSNYCISVVATATTNLIKFGIPSAFKCIVTESSSSKTGAESTIVTIVLGVFVAVAVLTLLIILHAAGLICLRRHPIPKACSFPKSESTFREHEWKVLTEKVCPVIVVVKEIRKKKYDGEETDESDTEVIYEDYASRQVVCPHSSNFVDNASTGGLKATADCLLVDVSGHETLSTAPTDSEEHQSIVSDESGATKGMTPLMNVDGSSAPLDNSGSFNVNLASVMLGSLPKPQEDDVASEASSQGDQDSSVSSQNSSAPLLAFDFKLLIDKIGPVGPQLSAVSNDCFFNEELLTDESEGEDSEQNRVSEYMSR